MNTDDLRRIFDPQSRSAAHEQWKREQSASRTVDSASHESDPPERHHLVGGQPLNPWVDGSDAVASIREDFEFILRESYATGVDVSPDTGETTMVTMRTDPDGTCTVVSCETTQPDPPKLRQELFGQYPTPPLPQDIEALVQGRGQGLNGRVITHRQMLPIMRAWVEQGVEFHVVSDHTPLLFMAQKAGELESMTMFAARWSSGATMKIISQSKLSPVVGAHITRLIVDAEIPTKLQQELRWSMMPSGSVVFTVGSGGIWSFANSGPRILAVDPNPAEGQTTAFLARMCGRDVVVESKHVIRHKTAMESLPGIKQLSDEVQADRLMFDMRDDYLADLLEREDVPQISIVRRMARSERLPCVVNCLLEEEDWPVVNTLVAHVRDVARRDGYPLLAPRGCRDEVNLTLSRLNHEWVARARRGYGKTHSIEESLSSRVHEMAECDRISSLLGDEAILRAGDLAMITCVTQLQAMKEELDRQMRGNLLPWVQSQISSFSRHIEEVLDNRADISSSPQDPMRYNHVAMRHLNDLPSGSVGHIQIVGARRDACPDCKGTGLYHGLFIVEPCRTCSLKKS